MKDEKVSKCKKCKKTATRVFTVPQANIDTKINPNDINALVEKTGKMKGTIGDLWDASKEYSEMRAKQTKDGVDPIKKKALKNYAKVRKGKEYKDPKKRTDGSTKFNF
jgi:hypothetical protein